MNYLFDAVVVWRNFVRALFMMHLLRSHILSRRRRLLTLA